MWRFFEFGKFIRMNSVIFEWLFLVDMGVWFFLRVEVVC